MSPIGIRIIEVLLYFTFRLGKHTFFHLQFGEIFCILTLHSIKLKFITSTYLIKTFDVLNYGPCIETMVKALLHY